MQGHYLEGYTFGHAYRLDHALALCTLCGMVVTLDRWDLRCYWCHAIDCQGDHFHVPRCKELTDYAIASTKSDFAAAR